MMTSSRSSINHQDSFAIMTENGNQKDYAAHNIKFDALNKRLNTVKKEFGMRRAVSTKSLTGETRTFAEILDQEVEKIVLFYLSVQGDIAKSILGLRARQMDHMAQFSMSIDGIERQGEGYRSLARDVLDLLNFLDKNMINLRNLIKRHDILFDQKLGTTYFDARIGSNNKNYQLIQLYHQEGIYAIIGTIRRGLEEYHEAKDTLMDVDDGEENITFDTSSTSARHRGARSPSHGLIPRSTFRNKLASFSNLLALVDEENGGGSHDGTAEIVRTRARSASNSFSTGKSSKWGSGGESSRGGGGGLARNTSSGFLSNLMSGNITSSVKMKRTISDLEPVLKKIADAVCRVSANQGQTTVDYLASHSSLALEISVRDAARAEEEEAQGDVVQKDKWHQRFLTVTTSQVGLYLNHFVTFIFMANQYIVAPTSAQYAELLGLSPATSGIIIGTSPAAVLFSALGYSLWSNSSFKSPLLTCVGCGIAGNLLYGMALQYHSVEMLLLGRLLTGFAGTRVISRRYIADHVSYDDRLVASSQFVTVSALGMAFGPLSASLIEKSGFTTQWSPFGPVSDTNAPWIVYTNETAPGWIMFVLWFISLLLIFFLFTDPLVARAAAASADTSPVPDKGEVATSENGTTEHHLRPHVERPHPSNPVTIPQQMTPSLAIEHNVVGVEPGLELYSLEDDSGSALLELTAQQQHKHTARHSQSDSNLVGSADGINTSHRNAVMSSTQSKLLNDLAPISISGKGTGNSKKEKQPLFGATPNKDYMGNMLSINVNSLESEEFSNTSSPYYHFHEATYKYKTSPSQAFPLENTASRNAAGQGGTTTGSWFDWFWGTKGGYSALQDQSAGDTNGYNGNGDITNGDGNGNGRLAVEYPPHSPVEPPSFWDYITIEVHILLLLYIINKGAQELTVSSIPLLTRTVFGWTTESGGYFMAVMGSLVLPASILIHTLVRDMKDRDLLLRLNYVSVMAVAVIINFALWNYSEYQYLGATVLLFAVLTCIDGIMMSLLSKLVSPELARGTFNSGLLGTEAGTMGRVLGDMTITISASGVHSLAMVNLLYVPVGLSLVLSMTLVFIFFDKLDG